jgi:transposase
MTTLADALVPDELWAIVAPMLPPAPRPWWGGRTRIISDRACFATIVFMARAATPWRLLPAAELGCGSYSTVRRRLDQWLAVGVFDASTTTCWTGLAWPESWTGPERAWTP